VYNYSVMRMLKKFSMVLLLVGVAACASTGEPRVGSQAWYDARIAEIELSHENGEITTEEYLRLKNETDQIRAESRNRSRPRAGVSLGFGVVHVR
jgi:hypothetical protein